MVSPESADDTGHVIRMDNPDSAAPLLEALRAEERREFAELAALGPALTRLQGERLEELKRTHGTPQEKITRITLLEAVQMGLEDMGADEVKVVLGKINKQ